MKNDLVLASRHLWRAIWLIVLVWTLAVAASVVWNAHLLHDAMFEAVVTDARNNFNNDLLCLTNPANMTRQMHELATHSNGMLGHLTSLKPLRPENAPNAWEAAALRAFEQGQTEVISRESLHGQRQLRFMKPLVIEAACLKCHAGQGYKVGDTRGGISVAVPLDPYVALAQAQLWPIAVVHAGLWALGVLGILLGARQMHQRLDKQMRAEAALLESRQHLRELFDEAPVGYHELDDAGRIIQVNATELKMLGYSAAEMLGQPVWTFVEDPESSRQAVLAKLGGHTPATQACERAHRCKDGTTLPVFIEDRMIKSPDGRVLCIRSTLQNVTERKRAQAELENVHKQLLEASRRSGMAEIATNVLHNVGNVLNSVNISTSLIVESVKKSRVSSLARVVVLLQEHAHDLGAFITNDSRGKHVPAHLAQLSEHLLAEQAAIVSELDSLRRNVEHIKEIVAMQQNYATFGGVKEMINVVNLVEDSLCMNEGAMGRHRVKVIREFENVPLMNVEKHKILQILVNLLRNAKHACQESERADKRLTVRVANGDGRIKISVIDNGVGIPPENLTRIFNYGFTTRKEGHGFGLHSGALAAKEMGGSLTVHSDGPGQGAAFTLELPCPTRDNSHE